MSHYSNGTKPIERKKINVHTLRGRKRKQIPITMITAYDYTAARLVDQAGVDMVLVGDSLAQVVLGMDDTVSITVDEMLHHCRAVARGITGAFTVGDMPFMSYNVTKQDAIRNAGRFLKEGRMNAVKLEGGAEMAETIEAITNVGIPVVGHIGFTPQSISQLGGYRIQGKSADSAYALLQDALALEAAGCIAIVLELVPAPIAQAISDALTIPTIGIGASAGCDGQVLVFHDVLGLTIEGHRTPRFVRKYANLGETVVTAVSQYVTDVKARAYPAAEHTYPIEPDELEQFLAMTNDA